MCVCVYFAILNYFVQCMLIILYCTVDDFHLFFTAVGLVATTQQQILPTNYSKTKAMFVQINY